jgi:hypothetical protein
MSTENRSGTTYAHTVLEMAEGMHYNIIHVAIAIIIYNNNIYDDDDDDDDNDEYHIIKDNIVVK